MALGPGSVAAVVLAGGVNPSDLATETDVDQRALLPFRGRRMLDWVLDAMRGAECVGRLAVVGDAPPGDYVVAPGGETLVESVRNGAEALPAERYLFVSADIPFLTADAVTRFCEAATVSGALFCYPIIPIERCEEQFPGIRRTTLKVREGRFTGGNMCFVADRFLKENWRRVEEAHRMRKRKLVLASMLGYGTLLRVIFGQAAPSVLPLGYLEGVASRLLQAPVKAIITPDAGVGTDVDTLDHWRLLQDPRYPAVSIPHESRS